MVPETTPGTPPESGSEPRTAAGAAATARRYRVDPDRPGRQRKSCRPQPPTLSSAHTRVEEPQAQRLAGSTLESCHVVRRGLVTARPERWPSAMATALERWHRRCHQPRYRGRCRHPHLAANECRAKSDFPHFSIPLPQRSGMLFPSRAGDPIGAVIKTVVFVRHECELRRPISLCHITSNNAPSKTACPEG
jgi:hypothetical protein